MKIIITLDNKNGMMFNKRRQSRDSVVNQRICELTNGKKLFMNSYSEKLFDGFDIEKSVSDNFLELANRDDFCFVENEDIPIKKCEELFVFRWNRVYPADRFFSHDLIANGFFLKSSEEFVGSSHEKITLEIFSKGE
jgi:hypothetical protein